MGRRRASASRLAITLTLLFLLPFWTVLAQDDSTMVSQIAIEDIGAITDAALLLKDGDSSPASGESLLVGADGDVLLVPHADPDAATRITNPHPADLYAVSWHPFGNSALLVGDDGTLLRYSTSDRSLEKPPESVNLYGESMRAVDWLASGQAAYLGGENGSLFSYSGGDLTNLHIEEWLSDISGIACHPNEDFCVVISRSEGIGIIDREGEFHYVGGAGRIWMDVVCPPDVGDRCVVIGSGRSIGVVQFDRIDAESSHLVTFGSGSNIISVSSFGGEFISASLGYNGQVFVHLVPFAMIEFSVDDMKSYSWLINSDVRDASTALSGTTPIFSWENRLRDGYIISTDGSISRMAGKQLSGDIFGIGLIVLVAISVPGAILGLLFMSSDRLQEKYKNWRRSRRRAKIDIKGRPKER